MIKEIFRLQTNKDFNVRFEKAFDCQPKNETYPTKVSDLKGFITNEGLLVNGKIEILSDKMPMNIELELALTRCNLDSKTGCFAFEKITFSRICEKMMTKTSLAYTIGQTIVPTPHCPFSPGIYHLTNSSSFSLTTFRMIPLSGYFWRVRCKFYEKSGVKRVKTISCVEIDLSFPVKSNRGKRSQQ